MKLLYLLIMAVACTLGISAILFTITGLVVCFKASIILGIIAFIIEPSPAVIGVIAFFADKDVANKLATWMHLPF